MPIGQPDQLTVLSGEGVPNPLSLGDDA